MKIVYMIIALLLINLIILAHEWGHYISAKLSGVKVNEFALGMGPKLLKFQKGETLYSLRAFPIGGFCAMEGEDEESTDPRAFQKSKTWKKIIIVSMGAIVNLILGFMLVFVLNTQQSYFPSNKISEFTQNSVSNHEGGLKIGDEILSIDGTRIFAYRDIDFALTSDKKTSFDIKVKRDNQVVNLKDVKFDLVTENNNTDVNIDFNVEIIEKNIGSLISQSFLRTISNIQTVWVGLLGIITGRFPFKNLGGTIGMVSNLGTVASMGFSTSFITGLMSLVSAIAALTINLGVFNLLPLPALDGGRLVFLIFELITRKKVPAKYEGWVHALGFVLLILLMLLTGYNDIIRLIRKS